MASYYVPTVVQTTIPDSDMTQLERLVLSHIFSAEPDSDGLYFFAEESPAECLELDVAELRDAYRASADVDSVLIAIVADRLAEVEAGETHVELDLTVISWATIFQDIVRRSPTLDEVAVSSAFTCSKMRPDGFGGMAVLITADAIRSGATDEMLAGFREAAAAAAAPSVHVLLRFDEAEVRTTVGEVIAHDSAATKLASDAVSDNDIHAACVAVVASTDLAEERGSAVFKAALAAIANAERRLAEERERMGESKRIEGAMPHARPSRQGCASPACRGP
ncbi:MULTISPECIES: hypothetical protein [Nitrobacteraceae]|uniref:Uncharacterized protein n=2 Tax=Afipia felis TaxID=1035 RepID=A0A381B074_AFIFE|nr:MULTISPECIES: hypothetical protein [Nitrobacteraceae]EKS26808.1 hypothetical protein HMPREF9697_03924 [Afipia felis ATCC 53690]MCS3730803.1 hypothetical protein [Bradyrhizobium betae]SUW21317.1 Uncharacterised protein [Afipia felis]SUW28059.1 Uncharacterised protein [Afipia felis]